MSKDEKENHLRVFKDRSEYIIDGEDKEIFGKALCQPKQKENKTYQG
ncbi:hypothetical protein BAZMOX_00523_6 [methanotrophic endosymbiont of Bathymodiolus azoricus (Menez Gwen)]|nr:hypothetical protein BAZMOX_00523_6 [methanotrophic endosymbiont of Bathymodiolus azoricus (Menez Gwen)]